MENFNMSIHQLKMLADELDDMQVVGDFTRFTKVAVKDMPNMNRKMVKRLEPNQCYKNCFHTVRAMQEVVDGMGGTADIRYVIGVVSHPNIAIPLCHAWVRFNNCFYDPTLQFCSASGRADDYIDYKDGDYHVIAQLSWLDLANLFYSMHLKTLPHPVMVLSMPELFGQFYDESVEFTRL